MGESPLLTWGDPHPAVLAGRSIHVTQPDPHPIYTALVAKHGDPDAPVPPEPVERRPEPQESLRSRSERGEHRAQ